MRAAARTAARCWHRNPKGYPVIVGRIDRRTARLSTTVYIVECPFCRSEYHAEDGPRVMLISNLAMCNECRNDSGRRERLSHARTLGESPFRVKSRSAEPVGIFGPGMVARLGASEIRVAIPGD